MFLFFHSYLQFPPISFFHLQCFLVDYQSPAVLTLLQEETVLSLYFYVVIVRPDIQLPVQLEYELILLLNQFYLHAVLQLRKL